MLYSGSGDDDDNDNCNLNEISFMLMGESKPNDIMSAKLIEVYCVLCLYPYEIYLQGYIAS